MPAPGAVLPEVGGQFGSLVAPELSLQSLVLLWLEPLREDELESARLLLSDEPLFDDVAPLLSLPPPIAEHPASMAASNAAATALAIPDCLFMTAPLHLDQ